MTAIDCVTFVFSLAFAVNKWNLDYSEDLTSPGAQGSRNTEGTHGSLSKRSKGHILF